MSSDTDCTCGSEDKSTVSSNLTGIRLFKSIVRRVRQKITESKLIRNSSVTTDLSATVTTKLDRMSIDDSSSSNRETLSPTLTFGYESRSGYGSDSCSTARRRDTRVRIRQKIRSRSKSDSRKSNKKKPKTILRPPPTYVYVRGLSGIPTQRIRVR